MTKANFENSWIGTPSEALLNNLHNAGNTIWKTIERCIERARDIPDGFEKSCLLNSVIGYIDSGFDEDNGGYVHFRKILESIRHPDTLDKK